MKRITKHRYKRKYRCYLGLIKPGFFLHVSGADWIFLIIRRLLDGWWWVHKMQHVKRREKSALFNPRWLKFSSKVVKHANASWLGHCRHSGSTYPGSRLHESAVAGWPALLNRALTIFLLRPEPKWNTPACQPLIHLIASLFVGLELSLLFYRFGVFFFCCCVFTHEAWAYPLVQLQSETVRDWFHAVGVAKSTLTVGSSSGSCSAPLTLLTHNAAQRIWATATLLIHGFFLFFWPNGQYSIRNPAHETTHDFDLQKSRITIITNH